MFMRELARERINLKGLKFKLSRNAFDRLHKSLVRPVMEHADVVWDGCTENECDILEHVRKLLPGLLKELVSIALRWEEMRSRRSVHEVVLYYKIVNNLCPNYPLKNKVLHYGFNSGVSPYLIFFNVS